MDIKQYISKKVVTLMDEQNLSAENLAFLSGLSNKTISGIIGGSKRCSTNMIQKICNVFDISVSVFFDDIIINYLTA